MGNTSHQLSGEQVRFIELVEDGHFGNTHIYQTYEGKYIAMVRRTFVQNGDDKILNNFNKTLTFTREHSDPDCGLVTPILHINQIVENKLCIVYRVHEIYCQYFNFTLLDMIKHKKNMDRDQVWFCFLWMLDLADKMKQAEIGVEGGFGLQKIFITLKGKPIVYIHHLVPKADHSQFSGWKDYQNPVAQIAFSILQLLCMTELTKDHNFQLFLNRAQKVDPVLSQLLTKILRNPKDYLDKQKQLIVEIEKIMKRSNIKKADSLKLNKFRYVIPKPEKPDIVQKKTQRESTNRSFTHINTLQGRKKQSSLKESQKKQISTVLDRPPLPHPSLSLKPNKQNFIQDFERKKRESERKKQKLTERKDKLLNSSQRSDKQNILANSIKQIKPSFGGRQSWTRKLICQHLKNSKRK